MRVGAAFSLMAALSLAACDAPQVWFPKGNGFPTYFAWSTAVRPFPEAARVSLVLSDQGLDASGKLVERQHPVRRLTPQQRERLERTIRHVRLVGRLPWDVAAGSPACFAPHHFFRYEDADGKALGEVAVCFCCLGVAIKPADGGARGYLSQDDVGADLVELKQLVRSMGAPTDIQCEPTDFGAAP